MVAWSTVSGVATAPSAQADGAPIDTCGIALVAILELGQVLPVDVAQGTTGTPISVPGAFRLTISPDARTAWVVSRHLGAPVWTLSPVDLTTGSVGEPVPLDFVPDIGPVSNIVVSPDGATLLIGTIDRLVAFDAATLTPTDTYPYPSSFMPGSVTLAPNGRTVFVGASDWNQVLTIELESGVGPLVTTGAWPSEVSITPDGSTAYTANMLGSSVTPIDVATLTPSADIPSTMGPLYYIEVTPDGLSAVVSNPYRFARVDLASGVMSAPVEIGAGLGETLMPDGRTMLVVDQAPDRVYSVDTVTGVVGTTVALGGTPLAVAAIAPSQAPTAAFDNGAALSGQPTVFDASASTATCGDISAYRWDYGDGTVETTSTATAQHVYAAPGTYEVTLTVTDSAGTSTTKAFTGQAMLRNGGPEAEVAQTVTVTPGPVATPRFTG